jgi:hypothetical protein
VLKGRIEVHTEFYEPEVLEEGESIYLDSQMGHAYLVAEGCDEALVLGICSSADESLMTSLMSLHGPEGDAAIAQFPGPRTKMLGQPGAPAAPRARRSGTQ